MSNIDKSDELLKATEVAHLLNVHINTVRRWSNQNLLTAYRVGPRGDRRFKKIDIERFLNGNNNKEYYE